MRNSFDWETREIAGQAMETGWQFDKQSVTSA